MKPTEEKEKKEAVKLDEVLKSLFSTSKKVLINLLNGIFDENFHEDEVGITIANNEFIKDSYEVIRGDMFFEIQDSDNKKMYYHIEFQTRNDNTMVVRTFEYGLKKAEENSKVSSKDDTKTLYFPKQKVIFFEKNRNIKDNLNLDIVFPDGKVFSYTVEVIKYWEFTHEELVERKMYPLIPLQLFNLRKELQKAESKNDVHKMHELSNRAKALAEKLMNESKDLFDKDEILGEDFHKMLLAIDNLIDYLNNNYLNDNKLQNEVNIMIRTLYDPEVEKRGIQKGIEQGREEGRAEGIEQGKISATLECAKKLLNKLDDEDIASTLELDIEVVKKIREEASN